MDMQSAWHEGLENLFDDCVAGAGQSVGDTHSRRMKFLKNTKLMVGSALLVTGLTLFGIWCFRTPSREITRAELDQFVQVKSLTDGRVKPTLYAGIYHLEAKHKLSGSSERVFLTTHLDESQIKTLFGQSWAKVEIPDQSTGQWVMVLSNLLNSRRAPWSGLINRRADTDFSFMGLRKLTGKLVVIPWNLNFATVSAMPWPLRRRRRGFGP